MERGVGIDCSPQHEIVLTQGKRNSGAAAMHEGSGVVDDESFYSHTAVLISNRGKRIRAFLRLRSLFIHKQRTVQDFRTTRQSEPNGTPGTSLQSSCSANSIALTLHWRGCAFPQLERSRFAQCFLHTGPTLRTGSFGSSGSAPVSFQADDVVVAVTFERRKLPGPIDDTLAHCSPVVAFTVVLVGTVGATKALF